MSDILNTTKGPIESTKLERRDLWHDDETHIAHRVEYWLDGEMVRSDVAVYMKKGLAMEAAQAILNGG